MKLNKLMAYRKEYNSIEIPREISTAIAKGVERGKTEFKEEYHNSHTLLKVTASLILALTLFTFTINISPSFADSLKDIPIIGSFVKVLTFTDGQVQGGEITDGTDIHDIEFIQEEAFEEIIIEFSKTDLPQNQVGAYKITQADYPNTLTFEISGARRFSAIDDLSPLTASQYVQDLYPLITLDDSLIRFVLVFNQPIDVEITEVESPASLIVGMKPKENFLDSKRYFIRTKSYPQDEAFAHLEESLMQTNTLRILKDEADFFIIEIDHFETEVLAKEYLQEHFKDSDLQWIIEARQAKDLPRYYPINQ